MRNMLTSVLCLLVSACTAYRVDIVRERVGCEADSACDDGDPTSTDRCDLDADVGVCNHERVRSVEVGACESMADCDDGDTMTSDACVAGDCHHTREIVTEVPVEVLVGCEADADCEDGDFSTTDTCVDLVCHRERVTIVEVPEDFDPSDPARQDARALCEMPLECGTGNSTTLWGCTQYTGEEPWSERGYALELLVSHTAEIVHVAPRLWVGDPSDRFLVEVRSGYTSPPSILREMTVAEVQAGFDVSRRSADGTFLDPTIWIIFQPVGELHSRALQWAFLPGDITAADGTLLTTCLQTGSFMRVPAHGILIMEEGPSGEPQCAGDVRATDFDPIPLFEGWVREVSDPTIRFLNHPPAVSGYVASFGSMREMIDWVRSRYAPYWNDADHFCARIHVVPDGTLATIRPGRMASFRPGVTVSFHAPDGVPRYGVADRNFTIRDTGLTRPYSSEFMGDFSHTCSIYPAWLGFGGSMPCEQELTAEELVRYTVVPTDVSTLDPVSMYERAYMGNYYR